MFHGVDGGDPKVRQPKAAWQEAHMQNQRLTDKGFNLCSGRFLEGITEFIKIQILKSQFN